MTKRKWEGRREGFRVNTTREEAQGPGRSTSRGRFSESWKRLSSRQGSTKRSGLAAQQAAVRTGTASVCGSTGGWHGLAGGWQGDVWEGGGQGFGLPHGAKVWGGMGMGVGGRKDWLRKAHLKVPDHAWSVCWQCLLSFNLYSVLCEQTYTFLK